MSKSIAGKNAHENVQPRKNSIKTHIIPEFPGNPRNQKCNMQQPVFPLKSQPTIEAKNTG
jgi:hypothetical protein